MGWAAFHGAKCRFWSSQLEWHAYNRIRIVFEWFCFRSVVLAVVRDGCCLWVQEQILGTLLYFVFVPKFTSLWNKNSTEIRANDRTQITLEQRINQTSNQNTHKLHVQFQQNGIAFFCAIHYQHNWCDMFWRTTHGLLRFTVLVLDFLTNRTISVLAQWHTLEHFTHIMAWHHLVWVPFLLHTPAALFSCKNHVHVQRKMGRHVNWNHKLRNELTNDHAGFFFTRQSRLGWGKEKRKLEQTLS